MSKLEVPPAKRLKTEPKDEEDTVNNTANKDETTSNNGEDIMKRKLVMNRVSKFENMESDESKASTSNNQVTPEDLQKLREFQVLDEVNEEDSKGEDSESSDKSDGELPDEEIEKMLEEDLPEGFKGVPKPKEKSYITRQKIVLEEKGINHFEVLPLDWMMVRHWSGLPVYMHRGTRVCTLSKPYFLGKGNTRRHDIPISAIPCLAYRKALEEEEKQKEIDKSIAEQIKSGSWAKDSTQNKQPNQGGETFASKNLSPQNSDYTQDVTIDEKRETSNNQSESAAAVVDTSSTVEIPENTSDQSCNSIPINSEPTNDDSEAINDTTKMSDQTGKESTQNGDQVSGDSSQNGENIGCPFKDMPSRKPVVLPGGIVMPPPRVETVNTSWKTQHLTPEQVNDYCKKLFIFKTVNIMHFKRWADRRKYVKIRKTLQYPTLPEGTKLITIPAQNTNGQDSGGKATKRDWVMNMNGCSYLSVFHEYVRRALQKQPVYEFKQIENAATPYQATVYIGGMQYGVGHGSSKRQAKSAAARTSIHILIPEMKDQVDEHARQDPAPDNANEPDFSFFDYVGIEDPRIQEFCAATSEPSPHAILRTCLLRNFGAGDRHIHTEMKKLEYQKIELTMKVGKHSATVVCKNKKQAKQRASQAILQALHPHIRSWGSLLRLYGSRSVKSCKEKKLEEQQITLLQDKAKQNEPNYAVLEKLRYEMLKLKERDEAVVPIGTLVVSDALPTHSGSMLNNVDL